MKNSFVFCSYLWRKLAGFKDHGTPQALAIGLVVVSSNGPPSPLGITDRNHIQPLSEI